MYTCVSMCVECVHVCMCVHMYANAWSVHVSICV